MVLGGDFLVFETGCLYIRGMNFELPPILFWDINPTQLDYDAKARYVICRVVMYGTLEDWHAILKYYGSDRVRDEMIQERYLDKKTLNYLSFYFDLPKEAFRCYNNILSIPQHWDY